jgi:hypothetical protein
MPTLVGGIIGIAEPFQTRPELSGTSFGHMIGSWLGQPFILGALAFVCALSLLVAMFDASKKVFWGWFGKNIGQPIGPSNADDDDDIGESPAAWLMRSGRDSARGFLGSGGLPKGKPVSARIGKTNPKGMGSNDDTNDHQGGLGHRNSDWNE